MPHSELKIILDTLSPHVISLLENKLSEKLKYHSVDHTKDVMETSEHIASAEGLIDPEALFMLRIAALYHDTGYLYTYRGHEEVSCKVVVEAMREYALPQGYLEQITRAIRATKIPSDPQDLISSILCDADLDYLGREDFWTGSENLKQEFLDLGIIEDPADWEDLQINFLKSHRFFTLTSQKHREPVKQKHLRQLISERGNRKAV